MKIQTEKQKEQALIRQNFSNTGKARSQLYQFTDHRLETATHKHLQQMAGSGPKAKGIAQMQTMADQGTPNHTGLPNDLKAGIENLSGHAMDDVSVHYNSDKPTQLHAHAFAQGTAIHIAPGQEKYLPHEAWHVVQQKQGRVKPTAQLKGDATKLDGEVQNIENVVQRVLHRGKTENSQVYIKAIKLGDYATEEVRSYMATWTPTNTTRTIKKLRKSLKYRKGKVKKENGVSPHRQMLEK
ncbi:hypothetical protein GCM10007415_26190 [Parapedobacter pyrenivorans]|uniref:eCIS core domain-containing protein n=1 Tax=Parapedobacter pyrenivorans TaxID=1305674 RepID=A0A917HUC0_9SPHI|nr:DUF4157 domain-containing protein [Parapedobacter pyrenivorans]GGG90454.1 hypothetical protein GCM10007415_26190 [Parapedobacter pyrenivorans]